jgi:hypothetical protein
LRIGERVEARLERPSMMGGRAPIKARGCPPICCANRLPPRPLRGAALRSAALTAALAPVLRTPFSMARTTSLGVMMAMYQSIGTASANVVDRVTAALVAGLEIEFGRGAGEALAPRFLKAEEADFYWEARVTERWLGAYESQDDGEFELDRIAILGTLDGRWFTAAMIVDGEGAPHGTLGQRTYRSERLARQPMPKCADRRRHHRERRRRLGAASFPFLSRVEGEGGGKRKQEKGTVSRQVPSDCLHIVFPGDMARAPRDMLARIGGNPPLPARIREICGHEGSPR